MSEDAYIVIDTPELCSACIIWWCDEIKKAEQALKDWTVLAEAKKLGVNP